MIIAFVMILAVQAAPSGDNLPAKFLGSYGLFGDETLSCSPVNRARVSLTAKTFSFRGETRPILMVERISDQDWHIWAKAGAEAKDRRVEEFHLHWGANGDDGDLVIASDEGIAEAMLEYGRPVADAGVLGLFKRCK